MAGVIVSLLLVAGVIVGVIAGVWLWRRYIYTLGIINIMIQLLYGLLINYVYLHTGIGNLQRRCFFLLVTSKCF